MPIKDSALTAIFKELNEVYKNSILESIIAWPLIIFGGVFDVYCIYDAKRAYERQEKRLGMR